jgi:hypothetical protein
MYCIHTCRIFIVLVFKFNKTYFFHRFREISANSGEENFVTLIQDEYKCKKGNHIVYKIVASNPTTLSGFSGKWNMFSKKS